jgi:hypothetical protein
VSFQGAGQAGLNGLFNSTGSPDKFEANSKVMVWSIGPDKKLNQGLRANLGENKDNILTWKQ